MTEQSLQAVDRIIVIQKELQLCVQDVDKTKKLYFDEEHSAHDVRDKAKDIEEKYVRRLHISLHADKIARILARLTALANPILLYIDYCPLGREIHLCLGGCKKE